MSDLGEESDVEGSCLIGDLHAEFRGLEKASSDDGEKGTARGGEASGVAISVRGFEQSEDGLVPTCFPSSFSKPKKASSPSLSALRHLRWLRASSPLEPLRGPPRPPLPQLHSPPRRSTRSCVLTPTTARLRRGPVERAGQSWVRTVREEGSAGGRRRVRGRAGWRLRRRRPGARVRVGARSLPAGPKRSRLLKWRKSNVSVSFLLKEFERPTHAQLERTSSP